MDAEQSKSIKQFETSDDLKKLRLVHRWLGLTDGETILHDGHALRTSLGPQYNLIPLGSNDENSKLHANQDW